MKSNLLAKILFSAGVLLCTVSNAQAPVAGFSINYNTICAKGSVQVVDLSTNAPTAWSYSVNGVFVSNQQAPELNFPAAGSYSIDLEATNGSGTSAIYTETLLVNALPSITVSGSTLVCTAAASTLSASGADTYTWSSGQFVNTVTITPAANTIYTLVGSSTLTGCSDSNFVSIFTVPLPTISVSNATICSGQSYTINPSGASTYTYSGGQSVVSPTMNTTYIVSGTDNLTGCSDSVGVAISVNIVTLSATSGTICSGQSFTIVPSGASTYTYSGGSNVVSPLVNATYTITGSNAVTGCSDSLAVTIGVTASPTITVNSGSICAGSVFTIQPTGASNYTYSGGSATLSPLSNTTIIVRGVDAQTGCTGFATVSLTVTPLPVITVNSGTICAGDVFTLMPVGASSYTFSSGASTVMPLTNTSYSVTGATANGCISQSAAVATVVISGTKPTVTITSSQNGVICSGETVVLTGSGASTYSWSTGVITTTAAVNPTVTTLFSVTGTDQLSGCSANASILQYVSECTGIEATSSVIQFNLYPNPSTGELSIETMQNVSLSVMNTIGQVVLNQELNSGKNTISLNGQPDGIYFVTLKQNTSSKTIRVIKH